MVFGNGVKNIQAATYNGTRTVDILQAVKSKTIILQVPKHQLFKKL